MNVLKTLLAYKFHHELNISLKKQDLYERVSIKVQCSHRAVSDLLVCHLSSRSTCDIFSQRIRHALNIRYLIIFYIINHFTRLKSADKITAVHAAIAEFYPALSIGQSRYIVNWNAPGGRRFDS